MEDYRLRQREYLLRISRALTAQLDLSTVLSLVIEVAVDTLAGTSGCIALREDDDELRIRASSGLPHTVWPALGPLLRLHAEGVAHDTLLAQQVLRQIASDTGLPLRQVIALPLIFRGAEVGVIYVFRAALNVAFSADEQEFLQAFADQAAIAVSNARLYQSALREKQRLNAIIEQSADGVMIIDSRWRITTFNRAMEQLSGWPRAEAIGRPCAEVLAIETEDQRNLCLVDCPLRRTPQAANPVAEGWMQTRDGRRLFVQSRYAPQYGVSGLFLGAIANVRDITAQKIEEQQQNTFISVISHELKTPVSIIKGYAETLLRPDARWSSETIQDGLQVILEESERLTRQINDLLDASRLLAGGMRLDYSEWQIEELCQQVARAFAGQLGKQFQLELRFGEDLLPVHADYERVRMVLTNLLSNAIKYSPDGGIIRISGRTDGDWALISVSDQGIGIAPEDQRKIFGRFYRADNRLSRETQGAGLGLFLTRAIIEAHGGQIWVESQVGRGSRFLFTLPLARRRLSVDSGALPERDRAAAESDSATFSPASASAALVINPLDAQAPLVGPLRKPGSIPEHPEPNQH